MSSDYPEAFKLIYDIVQKAHPECHNNEKDAITHKVILEVGDKQLSRVAFNAIMAHIRVEHNNPELNQSFTKVFADKRFCKRIKNGELL